MPEFFSDFNVGILPFTSQNSFYHADVNVGISRPGLGHWTLSYLKWGPLAIDRNAFFHSGFNVGFSTDSIEMRSSRFYSDKNVEPLPVGNWIGQYGSDGYYLAAWDYPDDLDGLGDIATLTLNKGSRVQWSSNTLDERGLEAPDQSHRRAAAFYDASNVNINMVFPFGYTGDISLYMVDWDSAGRDMNVSIHMWGPPPEQTYLGSTNINVLGSSFDIGIWGTASIDIEPEGLIQIRVLRFSGPDAVVSGIFLDP